MSREDFPEDIELERLVLGVVMTDEEGASLAMDALTAEDFHLGRHRQIYEAAAKVRERGCGIDRILVAKELQDRGQLESGGLSYLVELDDGLPRVYGLEGYLARLRKASIMRRAILTAQALIESCSSLGASLEDVARAGDKLQALTGERVGKRALLGLGEYLEQHGGVDSFMGPQDDNSVPLPWAGLRTHIPGLKPGQVAIIAARPGMGKSATAAQLAVYAAQHNRGVAVFSFEMSAGEIWRRMVAHKAALSLGRINRGNMVNQDRTDAHRALGALDGLPLWIDDTTGCTVQAMTATLRKHRNAGKPVDLVVVDYLQLMQTPRRSEKRVEEITEISRRLKLAARDLRVPIVVLSQLNRETEKDGGRPELHHLRESGAIEQDADIVIFLWQDRKERNAAIAARRPGEMELIISKHRNGSVGRATVMFDPRIMTLTDSKE